MADKLTAKQEGFALSVAEGNSLAQAYRDNYNVGKDTKPETVWRKAVEVMQNGKVTARLEELHSLAQEKTLITVEGLTEELEDARKVSKAEGQGAAMTSATMGKAKLHGLLIDKAEIKASFTVNIGDDDADCG